MSSSILMPSEHSTIDRFVDSLAKTLVIDNTDWLCGSAQAASSSTVPVTTIFNMRMIGSNINLVTILKK
ncbi:hypothetical protein NUKP40_07360 [Klebsiella variicola]|nr:hypothetical protein NUKP40_07360 [Klebsiella variicola]